MEEIMETGADNGEASLEAAFEAGFSGEDTDTIVENQHEESVEEPEAHEEEQTTAEEAEQGNTSPVEQTEEASAPEASHEEQETAEKPFTIPAEYLGETKEYTVEEATPLIQKGLDYDRIRPMYDEAKPFMGILHRIAKENGMTMKEYADWFAKEDYKNRTGKSDEEAAEGLKHEREMAELEQFKSDRKAEADRATRQRERVAADLKEFAAAFPEEYAAFKSSPRDSLPADVVEAINSGMSITAAYSKHIAAEAQKAAREAAEALAATKKNIENASSSTGSMGSAGVNTKSKDPFLDGWDS